MISLIEDDDDLRKSPPDFIRSLGHEVIDFANAEGVMPALEKLPVEGLVTDLRFAGYHRAPARRARNQLVFFRMIGLALEPHPPYRVVG